MIAMRALVWVVAAGCGRIGFDSRGMTGDGGSGGDGGVLADANSAVVFAGSCTSPARHPVGTGSLAHMAATLDGVVYADDFGELDSFQFADGALVPRATDAMFAPEIDALAVSAAGDRILVLYSANAEYTIVDRSLSGPAFAAFPQLGVGDYGAAADGAGFITIGIATNGDSAVARTGSTTAMSLAPGANTVPAITAVGGQYVAVADDGSPACHWRFYDESGNPTGNGADDTYDCRYPVLSPDDSGRALFVWETPTNVQARVRDLSTLTWVSATTTLATLEQWDVLFVPSRGWYVVNNNAQTPAMVVVVAADGSASGTMFTLPEAASYVRLFAIAGRPYAVWLATVGGTPQLSVQPLCF
jgi:hypothetical protein